MEWPRRSEGNEFVKGICVPCGSLVSAPPVVEGARLPAETSKMTSVTLLASVVPTAKIHDRIHTIV